MKLKYRYPQRFISLTSVITYFFSHRSCWFGEEAGALCNPEFQRRHWRYRDPGCQLPHHTLL